MKSSKYKVVICPPCGESVAVATTEGQNRKSALWPLLPRVAVLPPQGREMKHPWRTPFNFSLTGATPLRSSSPRRIGMQDIGGEPHATDQRGDGACGHGFTLIELLVVVLIIGILAAVALPQYQKAVYRAQAVEALNALDVLDKGLEAYYLEHGTYQATSGNRGVYPTELDINTPPLRNFQIGSFYPSNISSICFTFTHNTGGVKLRTCWNAGRHEGRYCFFSGLIDKNLGNTVLEMI